MAITRLGPNQDITAAKIAGQINFKNIIINGDMSIAQRGTSFTGQSSGAYYLDRFKTDISGLGTWTIEQVTDVPTGQGFKYSMRFRCTTADTSPAAGDFLYLNQPIEGFNTASFKFGTANAESLTLSFWVKADKTGTHIVRFYDIDNQRALSKAYTINSALTWEKKTITISGDTVSGPNYDNGYAFAINWCLGAGSNYTSGTLNESWNSVTSADQFVGQVNVADSTSNAWYITGVQLEVGTSASDFEFLPYDVNLQRCQRYFEICEGGYEFYLPGTSDHKVYVQYSVKKRTSASVTKISSAENCASSVSVDVGSRDASISGRVVANNAFATGAGKYFEAKFSADAEL